MLNKVELPCGIPYANKWCNEILVMWKFYHYTTQHPPRALRGSQTCPKSPINTSSLQYTTAIGLTWCAACFLCATCPSRTSTLFSVLVRRCTRQYLTLLAWCSTSVHTGCEELTARNVIYKWQVGLLRWAEIEKEGEKAMQGEKEAASSKRLRWSQFNKLVLPSSFPASLPPSLPR